MNAPECIPLLRSRFWTVPEISMLRCIYPLQGPQACLDQLPGRTLAGIYAQAQKLGLQAPGNCWQKKHRWSTTGEIDAAIRRVYTDTPVRGAVNALADRLRRPGWWVKNRAIALGLAMPRLKEPEWTSAEIDIITDKATLSLEGIRRALARHGFKRTCTAINVKLKRLHVSRIDDSHYTARQLADLFGIDSHVITRWIEKEGLPAKRKGTARTQIQGGDVWLIPHCSIKAWVKTHAQLVDLRKVDRFWFIDLI